MNQFKTRCGELVDNMAFTLCILIFSAPFLYIFFCFLCSIGLVLYLSIDTFYSYNSHEWYDRIGIIAFWGICYYKIRQLVNFDDDDDDDCSASGDTDDAQQEELSPRYIPPYEGYGK